MRSLSDACCVKCERGLSTEIHTATTLTLMIADTRGNLIELQVLLISIKKGVLKKYLQVLFHLAAK
jgi:hypothetical protein